MSDSKSEDDEFIKNLLVQIESHLGFDEMVYDLQAGKERRANEPPTTWRVETISALRGILKSARDWPDRK